MIGDREAPSTVYNWGPMSEGLTGFSAAPRTRPTMQSTGAGRLHRVKERAFVANPVGYVEYQGQLIPYTNLAAEHRGRVGEPEQAILSRLRDYEYQGGTILAPEDLMTGPDDSYLVGSGEQFRQANASIMSTVFHRRQMAGRPVPFTGPVARAKRVTHVRRP